MKESEKHKPSIYTPLKQESFRQVIDIWCRIQVQIRRKYSITSPLLYIDLNAGPGIDDKGNTGAGSPYIMIHRLSEYLLPADVLLFEKEDSTCALLRESLKMCPAGLVKPEVLHADHGTLPDMLSLIEKKYSYGLVYFDPQNAPQLQESAGVLQAIGKTFSRVDILINIAAATYKRVKHFDGWMPLVDVLKPIGKTFWLVRKPHAQFQWTMLILTNWADYPEFNDFYNVNTPEGYEILNRINFTPEERAKMPITQLSLFNPTGS